MQIKLCTCFSLGSRLAHIFPTSLDLSDRPSVGFSSLTFGLISVLKKRYAVEGRLGALGSLGSTTLLRFTPLVDGVASSKTSGASG